MSPCCPLWACLDLKKREWYVWVTYLPIGLGWGSFHGSGGGRDKTKLNETQYAAHRDGCRRTAPRRRPEARRHAHQILASGTTTPSRLRQLPHRAVCSATFVRSSTRAPSALLPACEHIVDSEQWPPHLSGGQLMHLDTGASLVVAGKTAGVFVLHDELPRVERAGAERAAGPAAGTAHG